MTETESFKQGVTLGSILHCFFNAPLFYLNGKEIESLDGLDLNSTIVTCIYTDYLGNLTLELKKKLYTVEIPNPNRTSFPYTLYRKDDGKIIIKGAGDDYEKREEYQLTESEIKQDFGWAWQWAKEVK